MSQRLEKMASLVQQIVAAGIATELPGKAAYITVTTVEVSPDLRQATIWLGILGNDAAELLARVEAARPALQSLVAAKLTTKFTPRLHIRSDKGGAYAAHIDRLIKDL